MSHIKTREKTTGIKALDKSAVVSERMRNAFIRAKQEASALVDSKASSSDEYASDNAQNMAENAIYDAGDLTVKCSRKAMQKGREAIERKITGPRAANRDHEARQQADSARKPPAHTQSHGIKTVERSGKRIKQTAKSTGNATVKTTEKTVKAAKHNVKTAEQTTKISIKTAQATAKAARSSAAASAKAAQKAAAATKSAANAAAATAKATAKAVAAAVKAIITAAKALIAAIAAGGWVAVLIVVIVVLLAAVIASPFGIFFSGESPSADTVPASAAIAQINYDFNEQLVALQDGDFDSIELTGSAADWADVLAVYSVKVSGAEDNTATYVAAFDTERIEKLKNAFFAMTTITSRVETISHPDSDPDDGIDDSWSEHILHISVTGMNADQAAAYYGFSAKQREMLQELLSDRAMLRELVGDLRSRTMEAQAVLNALPQELSEQRREIVKTACSLVGKVNYFWGGKSLAFGWDTRWGMLQKVWADGSETTGTYRPYGLDCSGFADWVFYNATGGAYYPSHGGGAAMQHSYCTDIPWADALPGDLAFYPDDSHVGIVGGRDEDGNLRIIHCSSGYNNVVVTGAECFTGIGRPDIFT